MINVSLSTGAFYKYNYKEIIEIMSQTSCTEIELCLNNSFVDIPFTEIVKVIEKKNLKVRSIHTPFEFLFKPGEDEKFWISKSIDLAKLLGTKIITTHITFKNENDGLVSLDDQHKRNLIEFCKNDIAVCAENMSKLPIDSFLCHPLELFQFINEFGISLTYDVTHWAASGKPIEDGYKLFKNHIKNIHLSDNLDGIEHKILGTGSLPIREFIQLLHKDDYNGMVTIELDLEDIKRNPIQNKTQAIDALNASLQIVYESLNL